MLSENTSASQPATADEIVGLLGELEPPTLGALLASGATILEIAAAANVIADEYGFGEIRHAPVSARDAELRAILEDMLIEDVDEREAERQVEGT